LEIRHERRGLPNEDELSLMSALLSRMSLFCRTHGILFVLIDIPDYVDHGEGAFTTSIPPSLLEDARRDADVLLLSHDILDPYAGIAELHVKHGQRHISEFSHLMFGLRAAQAILAKRATCGAAPIRLQPRAVRSPAKATAP
jgi:hypothetical protein